MTAPKHTPAEFQRRARKYFADEVATSCNSVGHFPAGGYVVFFNGKPCGWMDSIDRDRAENGRLTHRPGCVCAPVDGPPAVFDAVGGDYQGGAEKWAAREESQ